MEVSDVTMLGFVKAAEKFIAEHQNDGTDLGDLQDVNLQETDKDLSEKLILFDASDDYKLALIEVGKKAFEEYARKHFVKKRNVLEELGQIFNMEDELIEEEPKDDEVINEEPKEEINDFGIKDDDDILIKIKTAQSKTDDELSKTFVEVVENEEKPIENKTIEINEVYRPDKEEVIDDHPRPSNALSLSMELRKFKRKSDLHINDFPKEPIIENNIQEENNKKKEEKPVFKEDIPSAESKVVEAPNNLDDYMSMRVLTNPALDVVLKLEKGEDGSFREIELNEIKPIEDYYQQVVTNPGVDEDPNTKTLSSILSGLEGIKSKQERKALIEEEYEENEEMYGNIKDAYPYLDNSFIRAAVALRGEIEETYKENEEYILLHRITFKDKEELHEFVEVMISNSYQVNVDENKMIVDTFIIFDNEPGIIIASILGVANQALLLNGKYEGYRILNKETV